MNIKILLNMAEICQNIGVLENLNNIKNSIAEKGVNCSIIFSDCNGIISGDDKIITLGSTVSDNQLINIPLDLPIKDISEKIFNSVGNLIYGSCSQITVKLFGDISGIKNKLEYIDKSYNGSVSTFIYSKGLISTLKILSDKNNEFSGAVSDIFEAFKKNIYAEEDIDIDIRLLELLSIRNKKLSIAESLTGGFITSTLIDNPGASEFIYEGLVTYSNDSKIKRLKVDGSIIKDYGAVSYEIAYEMAAGLLFTQMCDMAIATTGIAGPSGGTDAKPVGLTFISVGTAEGIHVYKHIFSGNRKQIREAAAYAAMFYAIKRLKDNGLDYEELQIN